VSVGDPTAVRFEHGGSLAVRALRLLERGPATTAEVAGSVMGLRGDPGIAARAVFALLGADPRFVVSADGVWSLSALRAAAAAGGRRLRDEEFVVVDVETTGGSPDHGHRVTEVAAVRVSGGRIAETWSSLVNPGRRIPSMIVSLTGITDEMVRHAPPFASVARDVARMVEGSVFVAHNAAFDWRFVTAEMLAATGTKPSGRQLCTVRLARKLLPQLPSRSLDGLALYFGLDIESRHRALDDAVATAEVLLRFIAMLEERDVETWEGLEMVLGKRTPRKARRSPATPRSMEQA
jgi:DNA polymerase-3 subunit epsilon